MTDQLVLNLVEKHLVTNPLVSTKGMTQTITPMW